MLHVDIRMCAHVALSMLEVKGHTDIIIIAGQHPAFVSPILFEINTVLFLQLITSEIGPRCWTRHQSIYKENKWKNK